MSIRRSGSPEKPSAKDAERTSSVEDSSSEDESRLSRWSRRKRESARSESESSVDMEPEDPILSSTVADSLPLEPLPNDEADHQSDLQSDTLDESPLLTDADMPDVDTLTPESDFKPFMSKGVSHALRRKALRKLFASPFFQIRDGLDDYDDDFTSFAPLGDTITADMKYAEERKEMLRREAEEEERRKREQLASEDQSIDEELQDASDDDDSTPDPQLADDVPADAEQVEPTAVDAGTNIHTMTKAPKSTAQVRGGDFDDYDVDEDV